MGSITQQSELTSWGGQMMWWVMEMIWAKVTEDWRVFSLIHPFMECQIFVAVCPTWSSMNRSDFCALEIGSDSGSWTDMVKSVFNQSNPILSSGRKLKRTCISICFPWTISSNICMLLLEPGKTKSVESSFVQLPGCQTAGHPAQIAHSGESSAPAKSNQSAWAPRLNKELCPYMDGGRKPSERFVRTCFWDPFFSLQRT